MYELEKRSIRFPSSILYLPENGLLFIFDRVTSSQASYRKAWLLHGVNEPSIDADAGNGTSDTQEFKNASTFRFREGSGELLVHCLLPRERLVTRRGGPGSEFYTPGNDRGGAWGSGENWPLEAAEGGPLPKDPKLHRMWKTFWGDDFSSILPSNRKNVVPGSWRVEVSPSEPAEGDFFLHVLEIGKAGATGKRMALIDGVNFKGAASESGEYGLFAASELAAQGGEVSLPDFPCNSLIATGLLPNTIYELSFIGPNVSSSPNAALPGVLIDVLHLRSNNLGVLRLEGPPRGNLRLRIAKV